MPARREQAQVGWGHVGYLDVPGGKPAFKVLAVLVRKDELDSACTRRLRRADWSGHDRKEDQVLFMNLGSAERAELPEITTPVYRPQVRGSVVL